MLWKFVPNCWSAHAETVAVNPSGPCVWDDDVIVVGWSQSWTSSNGVYRSVHITKWPEYFGHRPREQLNIISAILKVVY